MGDAHQDRLDGSLKNLSNKHKDQVDVRRPQVRRPRRL